MNRNCIFACLPALLSLVILMACDNASESRVESAPPTLGPDINVFIGQVYPDQHAVLQPVVAHTDIKFDAWPDAMSIYPLYQVPSTEKQQALHAKFLDIISNSYVPAMENMPDSESGECLSESYKPDINYHYLLKDVTLIQDYFFRGMPDNCEKQDDATRYSINSKISASFPVVAVSANDSLNIDFRNAGKARPLIPDEKEQVLQFINEFKAEFKKAYGSEYDEKTNNIGEITTLANAMILLEAEYGKSGYSIRISTWEHITVAYHIYRIVEVSILKDNKLIESREIQRYQGVLG